MAFILPSSRHITQFKPKGTDASAYLEKRMKALLIREGENEDGLKANLLASKATDAGVTAQILEAKAEDAAAVAAALAAGVALRPRRQIVRTGPRPSADADWRRQVDRLDPMTGEPYEVRSDPPRRSIEHVVIRGYSDEDDD